MTYCYWSSGPELDEPIRWDESEPAYWTWPWDSPWLRGLAGLDPDHWPADDWPADGSGGEPWHEERSIRRGA